MKKKQKYYVIWKGHKPGIYDNWDEAKKQVHGFEGAVYKSFEDAQLATTAYKGNPWDYLNTSSNNGENKKPTKKTWNEKLIKKDSICVDAACSGNPGLMEYRCVETYSGKEIFHFGPVDHGTNNIGEFLGLVHAAAMLKKLGKNETTIYTDSITAISWVKAKKVKTTLERNNKTEELFKLIERAYIWLKENTILNPIVKWDTDSWGEIPADFGRK
jgi:ribonuclease HI